MVYLFEWFGRTLSEKSNQVSVGHSLVKAEEHGDPRFIAIMSRMYEGVLG